MNDLDLTYNVVLPFVNVLLLRLMILDTSLMLFLATRRMTYVRSMSVATVRQFRLSNLVFIFTSMRSDRKSVLILYSFLFLRYCFFPRAPVNEMKLNYSEETEYIGSS